MDKVAENFSSSHFISIGHFRIQTLGQVVLACAQELVTTFCLGMRS